MKSSYLTHLALFVVALLYGANYSIAKYAMAADIGSQAFILLRIAFGTVVFQLFYRIFAFEKIKDKRDYVHFAICGFTGIALNMSAFFKGLSMTSAINASVFMLLSPVFVLIFVAISGRRRLFKNEYLGMVIAFVGAYLLVRFSGLTDEGQSTQGDLLILLNAASYAYYLFHVPRLLKKYKATTVAAFIFPFGLLWVLPLGIPELMEIDFNGLNTIIWASIAYVLIGVTAMAYFLNAWALQRSNSVLVSTYIYLQPVLASIIALGSGMDILSWQKVVFGVLVLTGLLVVNRKKPKVLVEHLPSTGSGSASTGSGSASTNNLDQKLD
jgi:drug/metabolite transporter (DMT)-like permease